MAKKLSEMTPFERVSQRMKGLTNEEAEEVAVQILAQITAKHVYIFEDGEDYYRSLMQKIAIAGDQYAKEHSFEIAMGKVFNQKQNHDVQSH